MDTRGNISVADYENNRVVVFDGEGRFVRAFGNKEKENGQFSRPVGLCVDLHDNTIVTDFANDRVQVFDSAGEFRFAFGVTGEKMDYPYGVCVDTRGNIIVADNGNNRLSVWSGTGQFIKHIISQVSSGPN